MALEEFDLAADAILNYPDTPAQSISDACNLFIGDDLVPADNDLFVDGFDFSCDEGLFEPFDDVRQEAEDSLKRDAAKAAELKKLARAEFDWANFPFFELSSFVHKALDMDYFEVRSFLTQHPVQRDPMISERLRDGVKISVEYDLLHFKTSSFDEVYSRKVLHYEIAQALWRQTIAERKIRSENRCKILYAIGDAQLVLLLDCLRSKAEAYSTFYDPAETEESEVVEEDKSTGETRCRLEQKLGEPYYVRTITDERVVRAFQSLIAPCIMFCVGDKVPKDNGEPVETDDWEIQGMNESELLQETLERVEAEKWRADQVKKKQTAEKARATRLSNSIKAKSGQEHTRSSRPRRAVASARTDPQNEQRNLPDPEESEEERQLKSEPEPTKSGASKKPEEDHTVRPWQACVFFKDTLDDDRNLALETTVELQPMPYSQLPTQPRHIIRKEGFKKVAKEKKEERGGKGKR